MRPRSTTPRPRLLASLIATSALAVAATAVTAAPAGAGMEVGDGKGGVKLSKIGEFDQPVYVTQPEGERRTLFVVEQRGVIKAIRGDRERTFLDIRERVTNAGEQGLLSVAFDPDYEDNRRFYVNYSDGDGDTRVEEYRRSRKSSLEADESSRRGVLSIKQPFENHNGGFMTFGPDDELYIATGDGGAGGDPENNAQDLSNLLGKILRIDPAKRGKDRYTVPDGNPFVDRDGARGEIWVYGLRNPWRFSFDRDTGEMLIGDVGQDSREEVDLLAKGESGVNFGWSRFEGDELFDAERQAPGAVPPIFTYGRDEGNSITGGYVVRDESLKSLYGRYLYSDFGTSGLRSLIPETPKAMDDRLLGLKVDTVSSFGQDSRGRVYVVSYSGPVYRLKDK